MQLRYYNRLYPTPDQEQALARAFGCARVVFNDALVARLSAWAAEAGLPMVRVEAEVGSGVNGSRAKVRRLLSDPSVTVAVVEHRDRLGWMNTELVEAAPSAYNRRLVVLDDSDVTDDLVRDMVEMLTWFRARFYGHRSAPNRALKAVGCAQQDIGPRAVKLQARGDAG